MTCIVLHFTDKTTASYLVAGIPAAARAVHQVALAAREEDGIDCCIIAVRGGWQPSQWCWSELARLAPGLAIRIVDGDAMVGGDSLVHVAGEELLSARAILDHLQSVRQRSAGWVFPAQATIGMLKQKGNAIVASTAKPADGIVSRYINRPVSRLLSRLVLRLPGITPNHATVVAALLGIAMAGFLFFGGITGMYVGAVLFQIASIVDGVDGEIARATFRSSRLGAMLDSLTDAATNLAFFAGLSVNLLMQGDKVGASAGFTGLIILSLGMTLVGLRARQSEGPFTFDAVKDHFGTRPTRLKQWLTWLTMRDFYAAAAAVCVLAGLATPMLVVFAAAASIWFLVTVRVLASKPEAKRDRDRLN